VDGADNGEDVSKEVADASIEEAMFYCLSRGVSPSAIYGWDDGLDFHTFSRLFFFLKCREIEEAQQRAVTTAVGASSLFKQDAFKKFMSKTDAMIRKGKEHHDKTRVKTFEEKRKKLQGFFGQLGNIMGAK